MARRNKYDAPPPPRAFMGSNESQVQKAIRLLAREQHHMATRHITVEDLRQLFIPEHLRHSLKEAFQHGAISHLDQSLEVTMLPWEDHVLVEGQQLRATFIWDHNDCPDGFFPLRERKHELQPDVTPELREKWEYVQQLVGQISYEWGMVYYVFTELNTNGYCNTPQQMRFVWPAIRHLCAKAGLKELAAQLSESSARAGDRARVPALITDFMVPSVNVVNRTLLMDDVNLNEKREFRLQVNNPQYVVSTRHSTSGYVNFNGMNL